MAESGSSHAGKGPECPICGRTRWGDFRGRKGVRCESCGGLERHRLQYAVLMARIARFRGPVLHVAAERALGPVLRKHFSPYHTLDLSRRNSPTIDPPMLQGSILELPVAGASIGLAYVSHVLEHVLEPDRALAELARVIVPGGALIAEVPLVEGETMALDPETHQDGHAWAFGPEFLDSYARFFSTVEHVYAQTLPDGRVVKRGSPVTVCIKG